MVQQVQRAYSVHDYIVVLLCVFLPLYLYVNRNQTFQGLIESQEDLIGVGQALDDTGVKAPKILQEAPIFFFGSHNTTHLHELMR